MIWRGVDQGSSATAIRAADLHDDRRSKETRRRGLASQVAACSCVYRTSITTLGDYALTDLDRAGTDSFPPQIEDATLAATVIFWLRATRRDPARPLGKVLFVGINATEVAQMVSAPAEFVGTGTAQASQAYTLVHKPVVDGTTRIQVEETSGWTDWQSVDGFEDSTEDSRHYVLDPEAGTITFGNGVRGRAPQIGERIRALEYRYGGGAAGNVAAKAISKVAGMSANVTVSRTRCPASGGMRRRIRSPTGSTACPPKFRRRDPRRDHESDFQELALATPGAGKLDAPTASRSSIRVPKITDASRRRTTVVVWPREDLKTSQRAGAESHAALAGVASGSRRAPPGHDRAQRSFRRPVPERSPTSRSSCQAEAGLRDRSGAALGGNW